jgi:anti-sigma factor RsiW
MSDAVSRLTEKEIAELCALADGSLPRDRLEEVESRVADSAELREFVERQRGAVAATQALREDQPSDSLVASVGALRSVSARRRSCGRLVPRVALAGALAAVAAVVAAVVLSGGPGSPTVADAAQLASKPPNGPPPAVSTPTKLALAVDGVVFPNFLRWAGWKPVGIRRGHVDGRDASVVYYRTGSKRIAYVIVAGPGLPRPSDAQVSPRYGANYQALRVNGRPVVTWRRDGRTCVLIGPVSTAELLKLASWRLTLPR